MSVIRWEDPPPHGNTKRRSLSKYQPIVDELMAHPGKWAAIAEMSPGSAGGTTNRIRNGWGPFNPAGAFEAKSRQGPDGVTVLYARYIGEGRQS